MRFNLTWVKLDVINLFFLFLVTWLLVGSALNSGEFWWTDEARHAMDGVFFLDFFRDLPLGDPYGYASQYFGYYPALGFNWYPPFFAIVESGVFALTGISEFSARLTVLLFLLLGLGCWYQWVRLNWGAGLALISGLLIVVDPTVLLWSRSVMLEAPATALLLAAILAFHGYLEQPSHGRALLSGSLFAAALLTKHTSGFLLPGLFIYALATGRGQAMIARQSISAYVLVILALVSLTVHALMFGQTALNNIPAFAQHDEVVGNVAGSQLGESAFNPWLLTLEAVQEAYSWPFLVLVGMGALAMILGPRRRGDVLILLWIASWYLIFTLLFAAEHNRGNLVRYSFYLTPAMALLAARGLLPGGYPALRGVVAAGLSLTLLWAGYQGITTPHPFLSGYRQAAEVILHQPREGTILFCCKNDGNFILHVRGGDEKFARPILRADKILVSYAVHEHFGVVSYMDSADELYGLLDDYGVAYLVLENRDLVGRPEFEQLLAVADSNRFELLAEIPIVNNRPHLDGFAVRIYRYLHRQTIAGGEIVIPMPHIGREIRLSLDD